MLCVLIHHHHGEFLELLEQVGQGEGVNFAAEGVVYGVLQSSVCTVQQLLSELQNIHPTVVHRILVPSLREGVELLMTASSSEHWAWYILEIGALPGPPSITNSSIYPTITNSPTTSTITNFPTTSTELVTMCSSSVVVHHQHGKILSKGLGPPPCSPLAKYEMEMESQ